MVVQGCGGGCCGVWFAVVVVVVLFVTFGLGSWFLTFGNNRAIETPTGIFATWKINKSLGKTLKYLLCIMLFCFLL